MTRERAAGAIFTLLGAAAAIAARQYESGTPGSPGPGAFPMLAGAALCVLGLIIGARGGAGDSADDAPGPRTGDTNRPGAIVAAVVSFGLLIDPAGLLVAGIAAVIVASRARRSDSFARAALLAVLLTAVTTVVFVWGLDVPVHLLPNPPWWR